MAIELVLDHQLTGASLSYSFLSSHSFASFKLDFVDSLCGSVDPHAALGRLNGPRSSLRRKLLS